MKQAIKNFAIGVAAITVAIITTSSGCKNDNNDTTPNTSYEQLLTGSGGEKKWRNIKITNNGQNQALNCPADPDWIVFKTDKTFSWQKHSSCFLTPLWNGTWEVSTDNKLVFKDEPNAMDKEEYEIVAITSDKLEIRYNEMINGSNHVFVMTWVPASSAKTPQEMLANGTSTGVKTWRVSSFIPPQTVSTQLNQPCILDDELIFYSNGNFTLNRHNSFLDVDGSCIATSDNPSVLSGKWTMDVITYENDHYLTLKFDGNTISYPFFIPKSSFNENYMELDGIDDPDEAPAHYNDFIFGYYKLSYENFRRCCILRFGMLYFHSQNKMYA